LREESEENVALNWKTLLCTDRLRELSGGKPSPIPEGDARSQFDRDYDRTVFSTPVRRLQDKTQVFPLEPNDAVRTRLTHSLEVSTLARGVARLVARRLAEEGELPYKNSVLDIEAIAATCGLIHDLGNPPFGHAGEKAIASWFEKRLKQDPSFFKELDAEPQKEQLRQDFLKFEGNAQTLRIISRLQLLADRSGLNLTVGTLSASMKYTAASNECGGDVHEKAKPGYFASEQDVVNKIREKTGTGSARNPITYLVEACDDTIYATVDIEDAVKKEVVSWQNLRKLLRQEAANLSPAARTQVVKHITSATRYIKESDRSLSLKGNAFDSAVAQQFRTSVIADTVKAVGKAFSEQYSRIMAGDDHHELIADSSAKDVIETCKLIGRRYIYQADETLRLEIMGRKIIHDLMDLFWEGVSAFEHPFTSPKARDKFARSFDGKIYNLLSSNYRTVYEDALKQNHLPNRYHQFQLVTDYVCGMTDSFACRLHGQLTNG